jgi:hypothetical protein
MLNSHARQSKKGCDRKKPVCGRCLRLQQNCHGYRLSGYDDDDDNDNGHPHRQMKSAHVTVPRTTEAMTSENLDPAFIGVFKKHFCSQEFEILLSFTHNRVVQDLMHACALIVSTATDEIEGMSSRILKLYVSGLQATRLAITHEREMREDVTVVSAILICIIEVGELDPIEDLS